MLETIGFLELNSIAKGVEAADLILKTVKDNCFYRLRHRNCFAGIPIFWICVENDL